MSSAAPPPNQPSRRWRRIRQAVALLTAFWIVGLFVEGIIVIRGPNEILGWGERPSLQPDTQLGWRLIPSTTTRLRWGGYDYLVTSNSLGFPGPEPSNPRHGSRIRILVLGGGFTSAEGVNTDKAWPRRLEALLNEPTDARPIEILNLAVTGYGIQQQSILASQFSVHFRPSITILTLAPNDFGKAVTPIGDQAAGIGFGRPQPDSATAILTCQHIIWSVLRTVRDGLNSIMKRGPSGKGWHLAQLGAFAVDQRPVLEERQELVGKHVDEILAASIAVESRVIALLIPSAIQVCAHEDLEYLSRAIDLQNADLWDFDQPQRILRALLKDRGIEYFDLRDAFTDNPGVCPYSVVNMHWTERGHEIVARYVNSSFEASLQLPASVLKNERKYSDSPTGTKVGGDSTAEH